MVGLRRSNPGVKFDWQPSDVVFIKDNFNTMTNQQLADYLCVTLTLLRCKMYEMGIKRLELEYWTPEMITYLKRNYRKLGDTEIAERFQKLYPKNKPWTKKHIEKKRRYLNLKRTENELSAINKRNTKQGRLPGYWAFHEDKICEEGTIKIWKHKNGREFKVIKTKNGFVHYAPWLFEKEVGKIKKGYVIRLIDGNPLNVTLENLQMITRAKNAQINSEIRNAYPEELKESLKLIRKINKKIKHYEKQNGGLA
jgi:hypothetical protein